MRGEIERRWDRDSQYAHIGYAPTWALALYALGEHERAVHP